jgi:sugar O-acyltransferase (sialic acid O-acetyltransferase NeuD family)
MKTIEILGISRDSIAVNFDLLNEIFGYNFFNIYKNISAVITPNFPIKKFSYEIIDQMDQLDPKAKVFWGAAGPRNKSAIYSDFEAIANINKSNFLNLIHPSSYISTSVNMDSGILIEPLAVISSQTEIGFGVFIKRGCLIGHHNKIGDYTDINPGAILSGNVTVGKGCIIGSGAVIKDNVSVGDNSYIGMGSVVTKSIPNNVIAYGNPCKVIKTNDLWEI